MAAQTAASLTARMAPGGERPRGGAVSVPSRCGSRALAGMLIVAGSSLLALLGCNHDVPGQPDLTAIGDLAICRQPALCPARAGDNEPCDRFRQDGLACYYGGRVCVCARGVWTCTDERCYPCGKAMVQDGDRCPEGVSHCGLPTSGSCDCVRPESVLCCVNSSMQQCPSERPRESGVCGALWTLFSPCRYGGARCWCSDSHWTCETPDGGGP